MFIDDLLNNWDKLIHKDQTYPHLKTIIEHAVMFNVDNVKNYMDTKDKVSIDDCPNIYPLYPVMWFEWNNSLNGKKIKEGLLVLSDVFFDNELSSIGLSFFHDETDNYNAFIGEIRWEYSRFGIYQKRYNLQDQDENIFGWVSSLSLVALFSISLMHCKNVTQEIIEPSQKLNKARVKRGKKPLVRYHILNINPMKKVLDNAGANSPTGLKHALHICRGHFKDFSNGQGLFGKYQGLYWWEAQVRGKKENGVVLKDYKVSPN